MSEICVLCKSSEEDELHYGSLSRTRATSAHYYCVLMSTAIPQSGRDHEGILGFLERDIRKVVNRCKKIKCYYCGLSGANVACFYAKCRKNFHLPCGLENNCSFKFRDKFDTYCHTHNRYPKLSRALSRNMKTMQCIACLESFEKEQKQNVLAMPCCKIHLIHVKCAKKMTYNAGYFTKCPVCNNTEEFAKGLQCRGVFVPLQDASWERSRDAFADLTDVVRICDADVCQCPFGRSFSKTNMWKMIACNYCGSSAIHRKCLKLCAYLCDICTVVAKREIHSDPESSTEAKKMKIDPEPDKAEVTVAVVP